MVASGERLCCATTNYSELLAAFRARKHVLPFLQHRHILIGPDSSTTIPYTTHQAGGQQQNAWIGPSLLTVTTSALRAPLDFFRIRRGAGNRGTHHGGGTVTSQTRTFTAKTKRKTSGVQPLNLSLHGESDIHLGHLL